MKIKLQATNYSRIKLSRVQSYFENLNKHCLKTFERLFAIFEFYGYPIKFTQSVVFLFGLEEILFSHT